MRTCYTAEIRLFDEHKELNKPPFSFIRDFRGVARPSAASGAPRGSQQYSASEAEVT